MWGGRGGDWGGKLEEWRGGWREGELEGEEGNGREGVKLEGREEKVEGS